MFGRSPIAELQLRKRTLVIESELNRLALEAEWRHVCSATEWINHAGRLLRQANPWLTFLAPILGVLTVRKLQREGGVIGRLLGLLQWVKPLLALWQSFMGTSPSEGAPKPPGA